MTAKISAERTLVRVASKIALKFDPRPDASTTIGVMAAPGVLHPSLGRYPNEIAFLQIEFSLIFHRRELSPLPDSTLFLALQRPAHLPFPSKLPVAELLNKTKWGSR